MMRKLLAYGGAVIAITAISVLLVYWPRPMTAEQVLLRRILLIPGHVLWTGLCLPVVHGVEVCSYKSVAIAMNVVGYCALWMAVAWLLARKKAG